MYEITISLTTDGSKCLYLQIYEHIRDEIRKGKLLAGEKLPSTRSLAAYLQVARSTVDLAYGQLVAEGYVETRPQKGYFVCHIEELLDLSHEEEKETLTVDSSKEKYKYDFSPHAVSLQNFPYATWKRITKNILVDANSEMFALGDPRGDSKLRDTISRYLHTARGVNCQPDQIIIGAGNDYLFMLLEKILGRNMPIAMEEPTYTRAYKVFASFGYSIQTIPMDENGMSSELLKKSEAQIAYIMPAHQYPTGIVMPIGRRLELLKWAYESSDRYLIEDDYDSEFRYLGKPVPALQGLDTKGKVIYMGTFSKSIAPAIRVGYMVLPAQLLAVYRDKCSFFSSTVSRIDQQILNEFITQGYFERYVNKMRKVYKEKHDFLLEMIEPFKTAFQISGENAGLHILLTSRSNIAEEELIKAAAMYSVRVYGAGSKANLGSTILLGYGGLSLNEMEQGINELKKAFCKYL